MKAVSTNEWLLSAMSQVEDVTEKATSESNKSSEHGGSSETLKSSTNGAANASAKFFIDISSEEDKSDHDSLGDKKQPPLDTGQNMLPESSTSAPTGSNTEVDKDTSRPRSRSDIQSGKGDAYFELTSARKDKTTSPNRENPVWL